ncbi:aspartyl-phosphate phosphatase Spo0E family protein [Tumebacillus sp. DT12]|uniref:Aspartyl-phosphate phosphatase Spo0E family protein n=1 Tax=Tumebacillus lacus TaxID=2995335 RepID=A0ABT3WX54_9BACL|nr:aspartyl-phosphate phosphatase Spo0E family protein [Tumebacillus lacus]MCX7568796.1 aspartyl-phosphate phosphatase Spo0E family protein [Tumebacillus lacus]
MEKDLLLQKQIARLRAKMISTAERTRSLTDQDVIRISQELDTYLVQLQRMKMQRMN